MEYRGTHIDVNQIRLLILEKKEEIRREFKAEVIGVFDSYARGEEKEGNDDDVLARFGEEASLFDLLGLEYYLEDLYGVPVNVFSGRALHPMMKGDVLKDTHRSYIYPYFSFMALDSREGLCNYQEISTVL